jgi:hypothetical protein
MSVGMKIGPVPLNDSHTSYSFLTTSRSNLRKRVQFAVETVLSRYLAYYHVTVGSTNSL